MTAARATALILMTVLAIAACAPSDPSLIPRSTEPSAPKLALYRADAAGEGALLVGRLELDGVCLFVIDDQGTRRLTAWPSPGTNWDAPTKSVNLHGTTLAVGETGLFGGGEARLDSKNIESIDWIERPAEECLAPSGWFVYSLDRSQ